MVLLCKIVFWVSSVVRIVMLMLVIRLLIRSEVIDNLVVMKLMMMLGVIVWVIVLLVSDNWCRMRKVLIGVMDVDSIVVVMKVLCIKVKFYILVNSLSMSVFCLMGWFFEYLGGLVC